MRVRWRPLLAERCNIARLNQLILHSLSEHARLAPAPHLLSALVLHEEIVRLPIAETQLNHLLRVVANIEIEFNSRSRINRELRSQ